MKTRSMMAMATLAALAGCSGEAEAPKAAEAAELAPGLYQADWSVTSLRSTDKTEPATTLTAESSGSSQGCIADGGKVDPALFAEAKDQCTPTSSFVRRGRISMQLDCKREGAPGQVLQSVNARANDGGFEGEVSTSTYLSGAGDYAMTRTINARRVGECPPAGAETTEDPAASS